MQYKYLQVFIEQWIWIWRGSQGSLSKNISLLSLYHEFRSFVFLLQQKKIFFFIFFPNHLDLSLSSIFSFLLLYFLLLWSIRINKLHSKEKKKNSYVIYMRLYWYVYSFSLSTFSSLRRMEYQHQQQLDEIRKQIKWNSCVDGFLLSDFLFSFRLLLALLNYY